MKVKLEIKEGKLIKQINEENVDNVIVYDKFENPIFVARVVSEFGGNSHLEAFKIGDEGFEEALKRHNLKLPKNLYFI